MTNEEHEKSLRDLIAMSEDLRDSEYTFLIGRLDEARRERDGLRWERDVAIGQRDEASTKGKGTRLELDEAYTSLGKQIAENLKLRKQVRARGVHLSMLSAKLHAWNEAVIEAAKAIGFNWRSQPDYDATTDYPPGIFPGHIQKLLAHVMTRFPDSVTKLLPLSGEAWRTIRDAAWELRDPADPISETRFRELVVEALCLVTGESPAADPEALARRFHETYERLAPSFGYETRKESAKPWAEVPEQNRRLMVAVCAEIMGAVTGEPTTPAPTAAPSTYKPTTPPISMADPEEVWSRVNKAREELAECKEEEEP